MSEISAHNLLFFQPDGKPWLGISLFIQAVEGQLFCEVRVWTQAVARERFSNPASDSSVLIS